MDIYELKEKNTHGTLDFPLEVYHPTGLMASYHWHEDCEFILILSGTAAIQIGIDTIIVNAGECAFIHPNELHSIHAEDISNFDFYAIVFNPELLVTKTDICYHYLFGTYMLSTHFSPEMGHESILQNLKAICHLYEKKPFAYELRIKAYLFEIFAVIYEKGNYLVNKHRDTDSLAVRFEAVIRYIHENSLTPLTVTELATVSGYSVSHFTRFFKKMTGKTPIEYINRQRIYHAAKLLLSSDLSVLDVSLQSGFTHLGHFINTFKKFMNCTPYQYKNQ